MCCASPLLCLPGRHACQRQPRLLQVSDLPSRELVPGDLVELKVGDRVPADVRMIVLKTATLRSEQASLTGESVAVLKGTEAVPDEDCELQVGCPAARTSHGRRAGLGREAGQCVHGPAMQCRRGYARRGAGVVLRGTAPATCGPLLLMTRRVALGLPSSQRWSAVRGQ